MKNNKAICEHETFTYINEALIHIKKGEIYKNQDLNYMMCDFYKEACDEGECYIYDKNCKK